MARDEAIAIAFSEGKSPPTLRFYQWSALSFSIGAFQRLSPEWWARFEKACERDPIALVRRITGGRGLLHEHEITYAMIAGTEDPLFSGGIKETFYAIAKGLLCGLEALGIEADVSRPSRKERGEGNKNPLCFAASSWYEITAKNKKLIGSAQRRWRSHFLQQGSMMMGKSRVAFRTGEAEGNPWVSENQMTLSELLPELPPYLQVANALKSGFESAFDLRFVPGTLTAYELKLVEGLVYKKYGNPAWNRDRTGLDNEAGPHWGRDAQKAL